VGCRSARHRMQDLRTVGTCLVLQAEGYGSPERVGHQAGGHLDEVDPDRTRAADELCFGTVDTWLCWVLGGGAQGHVHVTDATNAAVTGLVTATPPGGTRQSSRRCGSRIHLPAIGNSSGAVAPATASRRTAHLRHGR